MTEGKMARGVIRTTVVTATAVACLIGVQTSGATFRGVNGLLVYQAQASKHIQLFTIRPEGTGRRQITHLRDSDAPKPAWSPDGRRIVFARDYAVGTQHEHLDIVTVNAVRRQAHRLRQQPRRQRVPDLRDERRRHARHRPHPHRRRRTPRRLGNQSLTSDEI
jgi:hypothetical protein